MANATDAVVHLFAQALDAFPNADSAMTRSCLCHEASHRGNVEMCFAATLAPDPANNRNADPAGTTAMAYQLIATTGAPFRQYECTGLGLRRHPK
ncbi:MAG: hypothetical protein ACOYEP_08750 [Limnochordia bacterium]|jgi:hypothetical protein